MSVSDIVDIIEIPIAKMHYSVLRHLLAIDAEFLDKNEPIKLYIRRNKNGFYFENPFNHLVSHHVVQIEKNGKIYYDYV